MARPATGKRRSPSFGGCRPRHFHGASGSTGYCERAGHLSDHDWADHCLPRQIEIWFVVCGERFYLFAETGEAAAWVKNIRRNPKVTLGIGERQIDATARVLDPQADRKLWDRVAAIANRKYGSGDGLPVELTMEATQDLYHLADWIAVRRSTYSPRFRRSNLY